MDPDKTSLVKTLITVIVIGGLFVVIVSFAIRAIFFQSSEPQIQKIVERVIEEKEVVLRAPKCEQSFSEYENLVRTGQSVLLAQDHNTYALNGKLVSVRPVVLSRSGDGEIACGYLFLKVHTSRGALDERYESVYVNPQDFGGHMLRPRGITFDNQRKDLTEVLFPLTSISYLPTVPYDPQSQNFKVADWSKLLNVGQEVKFILGLSVQDSEATLDEVRIAYRCWDPQTGKETSSCQLGIK